MGQLKVEPAIEYLEKIKARPSMYLGDLEHDPASPLQLLSCLLFGFEAGFDAGGGSNERGSLMRRLGRFAEVEFGLKPSSVGLGAYLDASSEDNAEALQRFWEILAAYRHR